MQVNTNLDKDDRTVPVKRTKTSGGLPETQIVKVPVSDGTWREIDLFEVIRMTREKPLSQISPLEASEWLSQVSAWRSFLWASYILLREHKIKEEDDFDLWWADRWLETEKMLRTNRLQEVSENSRSKTTIDPTRDHINRFIVSHWRDEWSLRREKIRGYEYKEKLIYGFYTSVDKFGDELRVIIKEAGQLLWKG